VSSVVLNSVSEGIVFFIPSKSGVYLLKNRKPVGLVGGIFALDGSDWPNGLRYHNFDTKPDTEFKQHPMTCWLADVHAHATATAHATGQAWRMSPATSSTSILSFRFVALNGNL